MIILLRRCFVVYLYSRQYMYKGYKATDILIVFICANIREPKLKSIPTCHRLKQKTHTHTHKNS